MCFENQYLIKGERILGIDACVACASCQAHFCNIRSCSEVQLFTTLKQTF